MQEGDRAFRVGVAHNEVNDNQNALFIRCLPPVEKESRYETSNGPFWLRKVTEAGLPPRLATTRMQWVSIGGYEPALNIRQLKPALRQLVEGSKIQVRTSNLIPINYEFLRLVHKMIIHVKPYSAYTEGKHAPLRAAGNILKALEECVSIDAVMRLTESEETNEELFQTIYYTMKGTRISLKIQHTLDTSKSKLQKIHRYLTQNELSATYEVI